MQRNVDYVITGVRELPSGHFEVSATVLHGRGYRTKLLVLRHQLELIDQLTHTHLENLKLPPGGPR